MTHPVVAPLVGAWIEMGTAAIQRTAHTASLLSWERGLKFIFFLPDLQRMKVAPLVGAWIEILFLRSRTAALSRRSSRGSVD